MTLQIYICSGLEDSRLNYLEQHANRLGIDTEQLEENRARASQGGPIGDALDACIATVSGEKFCELTPTLCNLIRQGIGSNTRTGTGRFIAMCCRRLGSETSPVAYQLMKALKEVCYAETSKSVIKSYASAYAILSAHAPKSKIDKDIDLMLDSYRNDAAPRNECIVSSTMLRLIALESSDVFYRYGYDIAPIAFVAAHDEDEQIAQAWNVVWEESTVVSGTGVRGHADSIAALSVEFMKSGQWKRKKLAALSLIDVFGRATDVISNPKELSRTLLDQLPGRIWEGKEVILKALCAGVTEISPVETEKYFESKKEIVDAFISAAGKTNVIYRQEALKSLEKIIRKWDDIDFYPSLWTILEDILNHKNEEKKKDSIVALEEDDSNVKETVHCALLCLDACWKVGSKSVTSRKTDYYGITVSVLLPFLRTSKNAVEQSLVIKTTRSIISCMIHGNVESAQWDDLGQGCVDLLLRSKVEDVRMIAAQTLIEIVAYGRISEGARYRSINEVITHANNREKSPSIKHILLQAFAV